MTSFKKLTSAILVLVMLFILAGCTSPAEQEKIDADNKKIATELAEKYFGKEYKYDFDFYGGGAEGSAKVDIYVFKNGDKINCIAMPAKENAPGPNAYFDCTLHQYQNGNWSLEDYEDFKNLEHELKD